MSVVVNIPEAKESFKFPSGTNADVISSILKNGGYDGVLLRGKVALNCRDLPLDDGEYELKLSPVSLAGVFSREAALLAKGTAMLVFNKTHMELQMTERTLNKTMSKRRKVDEANAIYSKNYFSDAGEDDGDVFVETVQSKVRFSHEPTIVEPMNILLPEEPLVAGNF